MINQCKNLNSSDKFTYFITFIIVLNSVLIGIEIEYHIEWILNIQHIILYIFTIEIFIRWFGKESIKEYFSNGWNYFDVFIVAISYIPDDLLSNSALLSALRILRVFRIFRLIKVFPQLRVITTVMIKSFSSLTYVTFLFGIIMYLYAIIGVILFRGKIVVHASGGDSVDPYGSIGETCFSLFRILTGEDWTDLRYNLLNNISGYPDWIVTAYHVSWMVVAALLLINIVVGAIVNNYDEVMAKNKAIKDSLDPNSTPSQIKRIEETVLRLEEQLREIKK